MNIPPIVRVPLKYGFFGGLLAIIVLGFLFYFGSNHPQLFPVFLDFRILLFAVFIFFSIKEFKDYYQAGTLHFWQGMIVGITCYLSISIFVSIAIAVFGSVEEEYVDRYVSEISAVLSENSTAIIEKVGEESFRTQMEALPLTTVYDLAIDYLLKSMFIGLFLTIIISVILRRQPKS
ncbi:MAG: DUF4199 domain-containing protein [Cyclobacteriaceae bacterium]